MYSIERDNNRIYAFEFQDTSIEITPVEDHSIICLKSGEEITRLYSPCDIGSELLNDFNEDYLNFKRAIESDKNKVIYKKNSVQEIWFDEEGRTIHTHYLTTGFEEWFDTEGNRIKVKDNKGKIIFFNDEGKKSRVESNGLWETFEYHENGNLSVHKKSDGSEKRYSLYEDLIFERTQKGIETEWDLFGNIIREKDKLGYEIVNEYDDDYLILQKDCFGVETMFIWDKDGRDFDFIVDYAN